MAPADIFEYVSSARDKLLLPQPTQLQDLQAPLEASNGLDYLEPSTDPLKIQAALSFGDKDAHRNADLNHDQMKAYLNLVGRSPNAKGAEDKNWETSLASSNSTSENKARYPNLFSPSRLAILRESTNSIMNQSAISTSDDLVLSKISGEDHHIIFNNLYHSCRNPQVRDIIGKARREKCSDNRNCGANDVHSLLTEAPPSRLSQLKSRDLDKSSKEYQDKQLRKSQLMTTSEGRVDELEEVAYILKTKGKVAGARGDLWISKSIDAKGKAPGSSDTLAQVEVKTASSKFGGGSREEQRQMHIDRISLLQEQAGLQRRLVNGCRAPIIFEPSPLLPAQELSDVPRSLTRCQRARSNARTLSLSPNTNKEAVQRIRAEANDSDKGNSENKRTIREADHAVKKTWKPLSAEQNLVKRAHELATKTAALTTKLEAANATLDAVKQQAYVANCRQLSKRQVRQEEQFTRFEDERKKKAANLPKSPSKRKGKKAAATVKQQVLEDLNPIMAKVQAEKLLKKRNKKVAAAAMEESLVMNDLEKEGKEPEVGPEVEPEWEVVRNEYPEEDDGEWEML